jgi:hypothetical protein
VIDIQPKSKGNKQLLGTLQRHQNDGRKLANRQIDISNHNFSGVNVKKTFLLRIPASSSNGWKASMQTAEYVPNLEILPVEG